MIETLIAEFIRNQTLRLMEALLDASASKVRSRFEKGPEKQALESALSAGLQAALDTFPFAKTDRDHYQRLFEEFLSRSAVADELAQLLAPRATTELDLALLNNEFAATGFDPQALPDFEFDEFIRRFVGAFYDAAATRQELQGALQIGILRGVADRLGAIAKAGERAATATERAADILDEHGGLLTQIVEGSLTANELSRTIRAVLEQGFEKQYSLLEAIQKALHNAGYDVEMTALATSKTSLSATK